MKINEININKFKDVEEKRSYFAEKRDKLNFLMLYADAATSTNGNTRKFWNNENKKNISVTGNMDNDRYLIFSRFINKLKPKKVLNIGCGNGKLEQLIDSRISWLGIDISNDSIQYLKRKFTTKNFECINILKYSEFNRLINFKFDLIVGMEIFEHIPDIHILKVLKKISKILNKNGILMASVPLNEPLIEYLSNDRNPNEHLRMYTEEIITFELEISGFKILSVERLYAFKKHYFLKKLILKFFPKFRNPNNLIIIAQKK